ncbi:MAG: ABC transporter substrate-binding protein [Cyanobacteria bacterium Co-bin13]|nr:ABC transporter substrate-binding protein [Cyanobacteria bacterium Co-bin13]
MVLSRRSLLKYSSLLGLGATANALLPTLSKSSLKASAAMPLTMQLDWKFNVQFAGPLMADHQGLYADKGLAVTLKPWESGMVLPEVVAADPMTIGCAEQNLILSAQAAGAPIRAIATMFQASPLALMSLPESNITSLQDLVGKQVGVHVDGLQVMELVKGVSGLAADALEVTEIPYETKYDLLLSGEMAAIQCYAVDEPIGFKAKTGIEPRVLNLSDYGYEAYAQVIFAHADLLAQEPEAVKQFLAATFAGWQKTLEDIPGAAQMVVDSYVEPGSKYEDLAYQTDSLMLVADYMLMGIEPAELGMISSDRWSRMAERFAEYKIIDQAPALAESLASGFWPAA